MCFRGVVMVVSAAASVVSLAGGTDDTVRTHADPRCGSRCLYLSLTALDFPVASLAEVESRLGGPPSAAGYSMGELIEVAESYGAVTRAVQTTVRNLSLRKERFACIAHVNGSHFVNIADVMDTGQVVVFDPPRPPARIPVETFRSQWDGTALLISRSRLQAEEDISEPWRWRLVSGLVLTSLTLAIVWHTARWYFSRHSASGA